MSTKQQLQAGKQQSTLIPRCREAQAPAGILLRRLGAASFPHSQVRCKPCFHGTASQHLTFPRLVLPLLDNKPASIYWAFTVSLAPSEQFTASPHGHPAAFEREIPLSILQMWKGKLEDLQGLPQIPPSVALVWSRAGIQAFPTLNSSSFLSNSPFFPPSPWTSTQGFFSQTAGPPRPNPPLETSFSFFRNPSLLTSANSYPQRAQVPSVQN